MKSTRTLLIVGLLVAASAYLSFYQRYAYYQQQQQQHRLEQQQESRLVDGEEPDDTDDSNKDSFRYQTKWDPLPELPGNINVHLVSHTHDDAGWQVTAEEYQFSTVDVILDNVLLQLEDNPDRRFVFAEMTFLASWFKRMSPSLEKRKRVRKLIANGQLEIVNGGWVQHDEACTLAGDMLDQTTRGHEWLRKHLPGTRPRIGWQLDPFGHSGTQAWLMTQQLGFGALFFARTDYKELEHRYREATLEYWWNASSRSSSSSSVFTSQCYGQGKYGGYYSFFPFEETNARDRNYVQDDDESAGYNVAEWISKVVEMARVQANSTQTSHQLWMLGNDFTFQSASRWFTNYDKLVHHVNKANLGVRLFYSTPSRYIYAKLKAAGSKPLFPTRTGDLMPLRDGPNEIWSGYFTSRPALKRQYRYSAWFLRAARQIETWARLLPPRVNASSSVAYARLKPTTRVGRGWTDQLEGALAVVAHHDGITGTARQSVSNDYALKLSLGSVRAEHAALAVLGRLARIQPGGDSGFCHGNGADGPASALNMSTCAFTSSSGGRKDFTVVAYNALAQPLPNAWVQVPVRLDGKSYTTFTVQSQTTGDYLDQVKLVQLDKTTLSLPALFVNSFNQTSSPPLPPTNSATHLLVFEASVPAAGLSAYRVEQVNYCSGGGGGAAACRSLRAVPETVAVEDGEEAAAAKYVDNGYMRLKLDQSRFGGHGRLVEITNLLTNQTFSIEIEWGYYRSHDGKCAGKVECISKKSGAYLFRPDGRELHWRTSKPTSTQITSLGGSLGFIITQQFGSLVQQQIRVHRDRLDVEFTILPIPIDNGQGDQYGKEVVVRYKTSTVRSNDVFYTDSNGMEAVRRARNQRNAAVCDGTQCGLQAEPVSSNYYPVTSFISIEDDKNAAAMTVLVDSAQGGTSLRAGEVELMVHRRLLHDDFRGVEEPLNETMCGCGDINARPGEMGQHGHLGDGGCVCAGLAFKGRHRLLLGRPADVRAQRRRARSLAWDEVQLAFFDRPWQEEKPTASSLLRDNGLPASIDLMTLSSNYDSSEGGGVLVRFAHLFERGEHADLSKPVEVDLESVFAARIRRAEHRSLSGFVEKNEAEAEDVLKFTLHPMQIKTLWIQFHPLQE